MHKLLFDQNLSFKIIDQVNHVFPNSMHVRLLEMDKSEDRKIWEYAKEHHYNIVTQDSDFTDLSTLFGYPPKIIKINTGNTSTTNVIELLKNKYEIINEFLDNKETGILEID